MKETDHPFLSPTSFNRSTYYKIAYMETALAFGFMCLASFFTLANPLGTMPVFLSMTRGLSDQERNSIVWRATLISFITLLIFTFAGQFLFKFFGISANGFRIAAGFSVSGSRHSRRLYHLQDWLRHAPGAL